MHNVPPFPQFTKENCKSTNALEILGLSNTANVTVVVFYLPPAAGQGSSGQSNMGIVYCVETKQECWRFLLKMNILHLLQIAFGGIGWFPGRLVRICLGSLTHLAQVMS